MSTVTDKYAQQVRRNVPVVYAGLTFHPLTVERYDLYARAKPAFELMQASLKVPKFARLPWCACLWALDEECFEQTGEVGRFLTDVLCVMVEALRLEAFSDAGNGGKDAYPIYPAFKDEQLVGIAVGMNPTNRIMLDMRMMNDVRRIIAVQNGYDIPDENWNPDLVRAAQQNAERKSTGGITFDLEALVYSVAFNCHARPADIWGWPIREFIQMQDAIDRTLNFQIYTLAEAVGMVKFTKGNPYPTWKFDRKSDMPTGFKSIAELDAGAKGLVAGT